MHDPARDAVEVIVSLPGEGDATTRISIGR
jgi:hypothetical protein